MANVPMWRRYLRFFGPDLPADIDDELGFHLEAKTNELIAQGLRPDEARQKAAGHFGNAAEIRALCRTIGEENARRTTLRDRLGELWYDLRHAVRGALHAPRFAVALIATLAIGVGGATCLFSLIDAWILHAVPYDHPDELVYVDTFDKERGRDTLTTIPDYTEIRSRNRTLQSLSAWQLESFSFTAAKEAERIPGVAVSPDFLHTLRLAPRMGRDLAANDGIYGNHRVALASDWFWRTRLQAHDISGGLSLELNGETWTVVGVLPADFHFSMAGRAELFVPLAPSPAEAVRRDARRLESVGRLRPGVTIDQARADLNNIAAEQARLYPQTNAGLGAFCVSLNRQVGENTGARVIVIVFGITLGLLLIACANAGNLLLVRALGRRRQAAIQISLGASAGRLVRQMLAETLFLFFIAACVGAALSSWLTPLLISRVPAEALDFLPGHGATPVNWTVFGFAMAITLVFGLAFGLGPALEGSRANVATELKESGTAVSQSRRARRLRFALVVGEIALAGILGSATLNMVRTFRAAWASPLGFESQGVMTFRLSLDSKRYSDEAHRRQYFSAARAAIAAAAPGSVVSTSSSIPFGNDTHRTGFRIPGPADTAGRRPPQAIFNAVSPEYFRVLHVPLLAGRWFESRDDEGSALKAIVNQTFVKQNLAGRNPIGQTVQIGAARDRVAEIVGVIPEVQVMNDTRKNNPQIMIPFAQLAPADAVVSLRLAGSGAPAASLPAIRRSLTRLDPAQPVYDAKTLDELVYRGFAGFQIVSAMLVFFGGVALMLATVGVYGVVAFSVTQRTREIGIRAALGADRPRLLRLFLRQGLVLLGVALFPALLGGYITSRGLESFMLDMGGQVNPLSSQLWAAASLCLAVVFATLVPAWKAACVDPLQAIRHE